MFKNCSTQAPTLPFFACSFSLFEVQHLLHLCDKNENAKKYFVEILEPFLGGFQKT
jgi:hypothetical protein